MRFEMKIFSFLFVLIFFTLPSLADNAALPIQGYITDLETSLPLAGGHELIFNLYESCDDTDPYLTDVQTVVFESGMYETSILLNEEELADLSQMDDLCLGIQIGEDLELEPRIEYHTTPYAIVADRAKFAETAQVALSLDSNLLNSLIGSGLSLSGDSIRLDTASSQIWSGPQTYNDVIVSGALRVPSLSNCDTIDTDAQGNLNCGSDTVGDPPSEGDITGVTAGTGLTGGATSGEATLNVNVGTGATQIVQLDGSARLPDVDASQLTSLNATNLTSGTIADARLSPNVSVLGSNIDLSSEVTGALTSSNLPTETSFFGPSIDLGSEVTGVLPTGNLPASLSYLGSTIDLVSEVTGTLSSANLPAEASFLGSSIDLVSEVTGVLTSSNLPATTSFLGPSIDSSEITDDTIATSDLSDSAVTSDKISDGSVALADLATATRTHIQSSFIESPATNDDGRVQFKFPLNSTLQRVSCSTNTGSITIQLDERGESTPNTAGTDVLSANLACDSDSQITTSFNDAAIAANAVLNMDVISKSGSPNAVRIHIEYTMD